MDEDVRVCGIAGAVDPDLTRARSRVATLNERQRHRGPDHTSVVSFGDVTLGSTRLAIQDPGASGNQPFSSRDGRHVVVFNGEIYNFVELASDLRMQPPPACDGAVIPELLSREPVTGLRALRGMFALAVFDRVTEELSLCRDPFGIKPLFWRRIPDGTVLFASEPRVLAAMSPRCPVDRASLARFLHLGALSPQLSPFEAVTAVPPNSYVTFRHGAVVATGTILDGDQPFFAAPASDDMAGTFRDSVALHLRSDVPTALLLSGGVDSSAIALAASQLDVELECLTIATPGDHDESSDAADTAQRYGHRHRVVDSSVDRAAVDAYFAAMPRPTIDGLNTYLVCRAVADQGIKVALSGVGGDEVLGGYAHFQLLPLLRVLRMRGALVEPLARRSPKSARLLAPDGPRDPWSLDLLQREVLSPEVVRRLAGIDPLKVDGVDQPTSAADGFDGLVQAEAVLYLMTTLLPDADAFSMGSSVELRVPFVVPELFAVAAGVRAADHRRTGKGVLVDALGDAHLEQLAARRKRGFSLPMPALMRSGELRHAVAALDDPSALVWAYVDREGALGVINDATAARWAEVWVFAALNAWLESVRGEVLAS